MSRSLTVDELMDALRANDPDFDEGMAAANQWYQDNRESIVQTMLVCVSENTSCLAS